MNVIEDNQPLTSRIPDSDISKIIVGAITDHPNLSS